MQKDYQLFRRTTPVWARLFIASVCAITLMVVDGSDKRLNPVHAMISTVTSPIQNALHTSYQWFADMFVHTYSLQKLALENESLKAAQAASGARLTQLEQIEKDNAALRAELSLQQSQKRVRWRLRSCIKWWILMRVSWFWIRVAKMVWWQGSP